MRKLFMLACALCFCFTLSAQTNVGIKAGVNFANASIGTGGVSLSFSADVKFMGGLVFENNLSNNFFLHWEALYIQKGFGGLFGADITFDYAEIPVLAKWKFGAQPTKFYVMGGPSIGYALSGSTNLSGDREPLDFDNEFNRLEASINVGGGVEFGSGFFIDARYAQGMTSLTRSGGSNANIRNKGFNATLGFFF
ncbi:MAG: porin family protein [Bacteroidota bacterium]